MMQNTTIHGKTQDSGLYVDPELQAHRFLEHFSQHCQNGSCSDYELYEAFTSWSKKQGIEEQEKCRVLSAAYSMLGI